MLKVLKEELSEERQSRFWPFALSGAATRPCSSGRADMGKRPIGGRRPSRWTSGSLYAAVDSMEKPGVASESRRTPGGLLKLVGEVGPAGEDPPGVFTTYDLPADYRNIASAIKSEARALTAGAQSKASVLSPELSLISGALSPAEARAVLGVDGAGGNEETGRILTGLLQLWSGDDAEAQARRQELMAAAAVLRQPARP